MIYIIKKGNKIPEGKLVIYIGRGSPLGNPYGWQNSKFNILKIKDRIESIIKYEEHLKERIKNKDKTNMPCLKSKNQRTIRKIFRFYQIAAK